ncbi:MAG: MFS transporter [Firmicutes bacterium HGW-Firmicutes-8]|nr:MAG: MFS transporter [Firmicutes bacterium HGW-Firmicutes-8]
MNKLSKWLILAAIIIGLTMDLLDLTIVNVAIPKLMAVFNANIDQVQWIATAYMMTIGLIIPITAYLADTFGIKKVFLLSLLLFTTGSALCGLSWSLNSLIFFRIVQALGGGMIMPLAFSIIYKTFDEKERSVAMGIMGIPLLVAPALGPVIGGYLVEHADWHLIFLINIPVGVLAVLMGFFILPKYEKIRSNLDWASFFFSSAGLASLLVALSNGPTNGWDSLYIVFLLIIAFFFLALFVILQLITDQPLLELRLFKNPTFAASMVLSVFSIMAIMGTLFLLPIFIQDLKGYGPFKTGLMMMPQALVAALVMPLSGYLLNRVGPGLMSITGIGVLSFGTYKFFFMDLNTPDSYIMGLLILLGIGMGLGMMPAIIVGLNTVPERLTNQGSSLLNMLRQVGSSFGIAILSSVLQTRQDVNLLRLAEQVNEFSFTTNQFLQQITGYLRNAGVWADQAFNLGGAFLYREVALKAAVLSFQETFLVATLFGLLALIPSVLLLFCGSSSVGKNSGSGFNLH